MSKNEDQEYLDTLKEEGVEIPETEEKEEEQSESEEESTESEGQSDDKPEEEEEESTEHLQETKEKKRTIYDDYKEKKNELKSAKETLTQVEAQRDELSEKVGNFNKASTVEEKQEAQDEIDEFAKSINADPEAIRKMQAIFLKGMKPSVDEATLKDLKDFKSYREQNQEAIMKQQFDDSFVKAKPALNELFPKASSDELESIKTELSTLSQEDEWKGQDLDFIAFKNKTVLSALVSPRKKGMESKGRQQGTEVISADFDPNADFTKMTLAQQEEWMKTYYKMSKDDGGLMTDKDGRKIML